jgi:energy-coupling factor transporter ATP-binding protein EcfA2
MQSGPAFGIEDGADYLRYWVASAVKHPYEPLPYLFFFGQQGCGKSIFVEMLKMLFPDSAGEISQAVLSESGFNGEAMGKVFGYIEEKDLTGKQAQRAYERIKEWVMAKEISIHPKGKTPYMARNTMKFIHFANNINSIKIDRDDTRVVAIDVGTLHDPIPKSIMESKLQEEIPNFLRTIMTTEIPPAVERCRVPHINTVAKMELGECSMSIVQRYAQENLKPCPGNLILFSDFKTRFDQFCASKSLTIMGQNAIGSELRKMGDLLVLGKAGNTNAAHIGNVRFSDSSVTGGKKLHLQENGRLA